MRVVINSAVILAIAMSFGIEVSEASEPSVDVKVSKVNEESDLLSEAITPPVDVEVSEESDLLREASELPVDVEESEENDLLSEASKSPVGVEVSEESNLLVDWGEWPEGLDSTDTWPEFVAAREVLARSEEDTGYTGGLYRLVDECTRRLELRSLACGNVTHAEEFRIPVMESAGLPCGFQVRNFLLQSS